MDKIIDKNYGSIPHLSTSKLTQQADKKIDIGSENILTKKTQIYSDLIIVTEKVDGSNVGIYNHRDLGLKAIQRKGYSCEDSPFNQHKIFNRLPCPACNGTGYHIYSDEKYNG